MPNIVEFYPVLLALFVALATGVMGGFALMRRMTLAGDTMSHIALPGLGLAFLWGIEPLFGALAALIVGALLIWNIEKRSGLASETTIGVIFAAAIALGALVTPSEEIIESLFGGESLVSLPTLITYIALSLAVVFFIVRFKDKLVLSLFNGDLARTTGINVSRLNLWFYFMFALTLVLGLRFLGTLLVGALVIVPAATARQLTETLPRFLTISAIVAMLSVALGYLIAHLHGFQVGPTVVAVATGLFLLSLLKKHS